jgi:membrane-associated phospholipid phosphatase
MNNAATSPCIDPVRYWNDVLLELFRRLGGAPGPLARTAAMLHTTLFDVVNHQSRADQALDNTPYRSYLGALPAVPGDDVAGAVHVAARELLLALHPAGATIVEAAFADCRPTGSTLGSTAAGAMLALRANDGSDAAGPYQPDGVPGAWRPTSAGTGAVTPHWGRVRPFSGTAGSAFRPPAPAGARDYAALLASRVYAEQVNEVKALGARDSATRTAEQTEIATFWANDLDGTYKPPGHLLAITADLAPVGDLLAQARLFALVSAAMADAGIVAWDAKYDTGIDLWRPESAIRLADTDGNPDTVADAAWQPLSADRSGAPVSPAFPAHVSGHATFAGAWATVLRHYFGTDYHTFSATSEDPHVPAGTVRTFHSFSQAAAENARSRVYLGVHYQFDADNGLAAGEAVGDHVYATLFRRTASPACAPRASRRSIQPGAAERTSR